MYEGKVGWYNTIPTPSYKRIWALISLTLSECLELCGSAAACTALKALPENRAKTSSKLAQTQGLSELLRPGVVWAAEPFLDSSAWLGAADALYPLQLAWPKQALFVDRGPCYWELDAHACLGQLAQNSAQLVLRLSTHPGRSTSWSFIQKDLVCDHSRMWTKAQ